MKPHLIALMFLLGWSGLDCSSKVTTVTEKDIEKLRVDYNKGKLQTIENLIAIYRDPLQPIETRIAALNTLAETQNPDAQKILRDFVIQSVGVNYALLTATVNKLTESKSPADVQAVVDGVASAQKKYHEFRTNIFQRIEGVDLDFQVEQLLRLYQIERENYAEMQNSLTRLMGSVNDNRIIPILIHIAKDKTVKPSVRSIALEILGKKRHPLITETFIDMLGDPDSQAQLRDFALQSIGDISEARVILALLEAFNAGRSEYLQLTQVLTKALGDFSDPAVIPTLVAIVQNTELPLTTRRDALVALIKFKDIKVFEQLLPLMEVPGNYVLFDEMTSMARAIGGEEPFTKLRARALRAQKKTVTP